jgi:hypothetical protein
MAFTLQNHWSSDEDAGCTNYTYQNIFLLQRQGITFVAGSAYTVSRVIVKIFKVGTPLGNVTVSITDVTADSPPKPGTTTYASKSIAASSLGTSYAEVIFDLTVPYALTNGVTYAVVVEATSCLNSSNCVRIEVDNRATTAYGGGRTFASNSGTGVWGSASTTVDLEFETYSGTVDAENYDEGTIAVAGTGVVVLSTEVFVALNYDEGVIAISASASAILKEGIFTTRFTLVPGRPAGYDPVLVWDPDTQSWIIPTEVELKNILVAVGHDVNGIGTIYFNEV